MTRFTVLLLASAVLAQLPPTSAPSCALFCLQTKIQEAPALAPGINPANLGGLCGVPVFLTAYNNCATDNCPPEDLANALSAAIQFCAAAAAGAPVSGPPPGVASTTASVGSVYSAVPNTMNTAPATSATSSAPPATATVATLISMDSMVSVTPAVAPLSTMPMAPASPVVTPIGSVAASPIVSTIAMASPVAPTVVAASSAAPVAMSTAMAPTVISSPAISATLISSSTAPAVSTAAKAASAVSNVITGSFTLFFATLIALVV